MRYVKMFLTGFAGLFFIATLLGLLIPSSVKISRGIIVDADSAQVEASLLEANRWKEWMPWLKGGAELMVSSSSSEQLQGVVYSWKMPDGKQHSSMTYLGKKDGLHLFLYAFHGMNQAEGGFRISTFQDGRTELRWVMEYPLKWYPWERFYGIFADSMIGSVLEQGLQEFSKQFAR